MCEWQSQTPSIDLRSVLADFIVLIGMGTSMINRGDGRRGGMESVGMISPLGHKNLKNAMH